MVRSLQNEIENEIVLTGFAFLFLEYSRVNEVVCMLEKEMVLHFIHDQVLRKL